ncbi:hypothetical protein [Paenibacillus sp. GCM10027626]|uniref:hypothetical protein n=1 Tax=Paenibacillus sp. GCM10027626 TaxID=3273411 RepID=UPI003644A174
MANLLTLALTETTQTQYEVVAWDLDENKWVLLPKLPLNSATIDNKPVWDLFQVTSANIARDYTEARSNVHRIDYTIPPKPVDIITGDDRLKWLHKLSLNKSVDTPIGTTTYVTMVEPDNITDIIMTPKENVAELRRPFFWENRIEFQLNGVTWEPAMSKVGVACKDLRWKTFWHEIALNRPTYFLAARNKWLKFLSKNKTFFVVEYYNNHRNYVIAGVHSLPYK